MKKSMRRIRRIMKLLGVKRDYLGISCVEYAMELFETDEKYFFGLHKVLYPEIARISATSSDCVERNIRTLIHIIERNGQISKLSQAVELPLPNHPTNGEFLQFIYACIQDDYYKELEDHS